MALMPARLLDAETRCPVTGSHRSAGRTSSSTFSTSSAFRAAGATLKLLPAFLVESAAGLIVQPPEPPGLAHAQAPVPLAADDSLRALAFGEKVTMRRANPAHRLPISGRKGGEGCKKIGQSLPARGWLDVGAGDGEPIRQLVSAPVR
jgi:hypothetical protein